MTSLTPPILISTILFRYIRKDSDVFRLIDNFIKNTTPKNAQQNDPFWEKSEIALDAALMLYLLHEAPPEEQNMEMMLTMIEYGGAKEDEDDYMSPLDLLFEALEEEQPEHIAVRQYKIFKQAAGKTAKSILVGAAVRLASFTLPEIQSLTACDTLELGKLGERKQAIFCIIPDSNDTSLNFLVGMLYTQAFQELYFQADKVHGGSLPVPVRLHLRRICQCGAPRRLRPAASYHAFPECHGYHHPAKYQPAESAVQRRLGGHHRQCRRFRLPGRQRAEHPQVHFRAVGQGNH